MKLAGFKTQSPNISSADKKEGLAIDQTTSRKAKQPGA